MQQQQNQQHHHSQQQHHHHSINSVSPLNALEVGSLSKQECRPNYHRTITVDVQLGRSQHRSIGEDDLVGMLVKMKRTKVFLHLVCLKKVDIKKGKLQ